MLFQQSGSLKHWAQAKDHIQGAGSATRTEFHFARAEVLGVPGLIQEPLFWIRGIKGTGWAKEWAAPSLGSSSLAEGGVYSLKTSKAKISSSGQLKGMECPRKWDLMGTCSHLRILE